MTVASLAVVLAGSALGYVPVERAVDCLPNATRYRSLSVSEMRLHLHEIEEALAPWTKVPPHVAAGYKGPWIENWWIQKLGGDESLHNVGLVPLFVPWVDVWVRGRYRYPPGFAGAVKKALRSDVAYVTVSQNDEGIVGKGELEGLENVLVLSAGGFGHVPIPLIKGHLGRARTPSQFHYFASFLGTVGHAPGALRERMAAAIRDFSRRHPDGGQGYCGKRADWQEVMAASKLSLCPRGYGRTSYHLAETVQLGLVPVYIYSDVPWVPYAGLFETIGFVVAIGDLKHFLEAQFAKLEDDDILRRQAVARNLTATHFTYEGAIDQIKKFILDPPSSALRCTHPPPTIRDE